MQCAMLRVTRRRKSGFIGKSKQNQCYNELLNAYQSAMTCTMGHNHTGKHQARLCLYFETQSTLICALSFTLNLKVKNAQNPARKHFEKTTSTILLSLFFTNTVYFTSVHIVLSLWLTLCVLVWVFMFVCACVCECVSVYVMKRDKFT